MGACFRRLSKLPCWDLLLLSRTGMHPLAGIIPLRQTHDLPPFNDSSLAADIKTPASSLPHRAQRFLLASRGRSWG